MIAPFLRHLGTIHYHQPCISRLRVWPLYPSGFLCRSYGTGRLRPSRKWLVYSTSAIGLAAAGVIAFETSQPFRYTVHAIERCSRVASAAILGAIDYKWTFAQKYASEEEREQAYSMCHKRSALRVRHALLANGGVFIKMGQHMASLYVLPREWTSAMRPLQDQCEPTHYDDIEKLILQDMGTSIPEIFDEFDRRPIGVASLAQVHVGRLKDSGKLVAVKLQHPHLAEFCNIDMNMVEVTLGWIKSWFPEFEFTWLGEEMRNNLPKEMDFVHEANNAIKVAHDFQHISTSLYIPEVVVAKKRVLIMEYIQGGRVDDLAYLASNNIDRNKVALELSRIFSQMVFINGWFHADPHPGNLLIRPAGPKSKSPFNFEVVLLDHGLYFDIDPLLRVNYSKFWLSLIAPATPSTLAERRKYAELVGNITPELYPVFESAITGRAGLEFTWTEEDGSTVVRASGMINIKPQTEEEMIAIRDAVIGQEGVLLSVFDLLRRIPRRVLMVLKLNDLTRSLDHALATTHSNVSPILHAYHPLKVGQIRVFLITAKYCAYSVWQDERSRLFDACRSRSIFSLLKEYFLCWWKYETINTRMTMFEVLLDFQALTIKLAAWCRGLYSKGVSGAHRAASGLDY
ncbi:ABC1 family-domain-containing protein [Amanita rubescens]|nr:ABC1 family-domain-containing protein [Amanita rubescens]